jgi:hypothetical protein
MSFYPCGERSDGASFRISSFSYPIARSSSVLRTNVPSNNACLALASNGTKFEDAFPAKEGCLVNPHGNSQ